MASIAELMKAGHPYCLSVWIEGIPYIFSETVPARADAAAAVTVPAGYQSVVPALLIGDTQSISIELDRETGISRGAALDVKLAYEAITEAGLNSFFARPTARAHVGVDLAHDAETIIVDNVAGFAGSGALYLGRELITYAALDGGIRFTGCTRGVNSEAYTVKANSPTYRTVTQPGPMFWRGRFVTLRLHMLSPEGRMLDSAWNGTTYSLDLWQGTIDETPRPDDGGLVFRCLPLVRLPATRVGVSQKLEINGIPADDGAQAIFFDSESGPSELDRRYVYVGPHTTVNLDAWYVISSTTYIASVTITPYASPDFVTVEAFMHKVCSDAVSWSDVTYSGVHFLDMHYWGHSEFGTGTGAFVVNAFPQVGAGVTFSPSTFQVQLNLSPGCYWVAPGKQQINYQPVPTSALDALGQIAYLLLSNIYLKPITAVGPGFWLNFTPTDSEAWNDTGSVPAQGVGFLSGGVGQDGKELISWSAVQVMDDGSVCIKISARGMGGTKIAQNLTGASLTVCTGYTGTLGRILLVLLQSSGTGQRDDPAESVPDDILSLGSGYGIPHRLIDRNTFEHLDLQLEDNIPAIDDQRSSLADLVGGWLVLWDRNLTQQIGKDNTCKLRIVSCTASDKPDPDAMPITDSDVYLSGVSVQRAAKSPNEIHLDRASVTDDDAALITVRDVPRCMSEGPRTMKIRAPGIQPITALHRATAKIGYGDGQSVVTLPVGPWMYHAQPGRHVNATISHPRTYDWSTGVAGGSASVNAMVAGWKFDLSTGRTDLTLLMLGHQIGPAYYCPTSKIASVPSSDTITLGTAGWAVLFLTAGQSIRIYNPGDETTRNETKVILSITDDSVRLTTSAPAWIIPNFTRVTYPLLTEADAVQDDYAFVSADFTWEY